MWTSEHTKVSKPGKCDDYDDEANDDNGARQSNKTPGHSNIWLTNLYMFHKKIRKNYYYNYCHNIIYLMA